MSEATKNSPSPRPTTSGGPLRTATILSGSSAAISDEREEPAQAAAAPGGRVSTSPSVRHLLLDEVRDDLGVGLGLERDGPRLRALLQSR